MKPVCIVNSVLAAGPGPLSYSPSRSAFGTEERLKQTLASLASVRRHIRGVKVVVVEMGRPTGLKEKLRRASDEFIDVGGNRLVRWACDGPHKGLGEAAGLLAAAGRLDRSGDYYFKLSGRYQLTGAFKPRAWTGDHFTFRRYDLTLSTRFYGFPARLFSVWRRGLLKSLPGLAWGTGIEKVLPRHLPQDQVVSLASLGIRGISAADGIPLSE